MNFPNKYSYKIKEAVKSNKAKWILFVPFAKTILGWFQLHYFNLIIDGLMC